MCRAPFPSFPLLDVTVPLHAGRLQSDAVPESRLETWACFTLSPSLPASPPPSSPLSLPPSHSPTGFRPARARGPQRPADQEPERWAEAPGLVRTAISTSFSKKIKMGPHSPAHLVRLRPAAHSPCDVRRCSAHAYRVRIGPCNPMLAARPMPVRRPARWCTTRSCWCSMSPRWGSTRCCGPRSGRTSST